MPDATWTRCGQILALNRQCQPQPEKKESSSTVPVSRIEGTAKYAKHAKKSLPVRVVRVVRGLKFFLAGDLGREIPFEHFAPDRYGDGVARVAQLDRVSASEAEGCGFDPRRAHQLCTPDSRKTLSKINGFGTIRGSNRPSNVV